jgi:hypothetical protein
MDISIKVFGSYHLKVLYATFKQGNPIYNSQYCVSRNGKFIVAGSRSKTVFSEREYHHEEHEGHKVKLIVEFFVIFVYFVVDKFYNVLHEPRLPLRRRPPRLPLGLHLSQ